MRDVTSDEVISHECVSGDDLCEFFPFIISIENGNVQYHSNHTGSAQAALTVSMVRPMTPYLNYNRETSPRNDDPFNFDSLITASK